MTTRALGDRPPEHPDADRQVDRAHPRSAAPALDARVVGEAEVTGGRVDEVDHRAVGLEQARGLGDGGDRAARGSRRAAVGIPAGRRASPGAAWSTADAVGEGLAARATGARASCARPAWCRGRHDGEDTPSAHERRHRRSADGGYVIRPMRPPSRGRTSGLRRATCHDRGRLPTASRGAAGDDAARRRRSDRPDTAQRGPRPDVRLPHLPPPGRRRRSAPRSSLCPRHRLHPLDARRPAVHPERRRLRRRRRRDDHPARPRRPLPLDRPRRPHRLRRHRDRRLGRHGPVLHAPRTSPRPSRSR